MTFDQSKAVEVGFKKNTDIRNDNIENYFYRGVGNLLQFNVVHSNKGHHSKDLLCRRQVGGYLRALW